MLTNLIAILRQAQLLSLTQEKALVEHIQASGASAPEALLDLAIFDSQELSEHISQLFALPIQNLSDYAYPELCQQLGLRELIMRYQALPIENNGLVLTLAMADPTHLQAEEEFRFATGLAIEVVLADYKVLQGAIRRLYGRSLAGHSAQGKEISQDELASLVDISDDEQQQVEDLSQDDSPVSRFINQILLDAVRKGASDIHFEPYESLYRVRLRCDGILVQTQQPASHLGRRLAARIKILAKLDIAERRLPQDGRIKLRLNATTAIDMRVSTLPTLWGEKIVLRLLDSSAASLDIDKLGYNEMQKQLYLNALKQPQGMILMTGPTGSGKTVSLYTGLSLLNREQVNISTAEDPVEINLPGINQVQVQPKIGFGFAKALRSFLRQDPDIVMVGEIRDVETAEIAVKAAQTGHLVLSTLHTNSAAETVIRLTNMGIEPFNLASSLSLIIAQRLARRLCPNCKVAKQPNVTEQQQFDLSADDILYAADPNGCSECTKGYSGRVGIYEVMAFNSQLAEAIMQRASITHIEAIAKANGMQTLQESGIEKLQQGITSIDELQRVLYF
ncbi:type IV-A pilus assembly ATPase PilB [Vibrio metschnikovii]|uniref:Type IV-A pilus assembly ATPase PilB n=1 Tax=bacterium 19MO03SA05 TaxID=2920620 RepID=A0AAU6VFP0_UNCXX|nr:type IV-A pilus assembly ATPase PilB [Vibrio metschnikovii]EKO3572310.1 type IV-A pilus assembly ATPase PilB [Vibrio metschnikovii]EKO3578051.1 type IV-A pilus assembly ATPase PilB [Vibrio metschnikovii]EKO3686358.1 type IV-A pilus assembly ATPase PilB [Vibrio metschnikovii]EKO3689739.1 type IV-A pilus assembly ATPase PilB [Vibrio metschnikovii]EKO3707535.1 type IV-A pilus assembly ATPase PilB [Vibrio metschnikovii]